ncbi:MAG: TIGR04438 family Trp-rich protein [Rubrivivax sp.]|nr:TIGR04438 family Trp-rich protein [Rubrivivax sp.]
MLFVVIGVILLVMNWTGIGPPAAWNFDLLGDMWKFAWPFLAAIIWWSWSDSTGRTQRKAIERMEKRKVDRRERAMEALGLGPKGRKSRHTGANDSAVRTSAGALDQSDDRDLARRQDPRL